MHVRILPHEDVDNVCWGGKQRGKEIETFNRTSFLRLILDEIIYIWMATISKPLLIFFDQILK